MLLSVIVSVKNDAVMLSQLLAGIQRQTFKDYEMLVIDGGSSDNTVKVVQNYYETILLQSNDSEDARDMCSSALDKNTASDHAQGMYLLHIDADMRLHDSEQLQRIMEYVYQNNIIAASPKIIGYDGGIRELFRRYVDPVLTQFILVRKDVFMSLKGFPICDILDYGLHNRYRIHGHHPILLDEEVEHLRDYSQRFPNDWYFLPWLVESV